ncbi:MAG: DHH family protein [Ruminococcaceae bacterium]|nr:DHH family protein [Oscillospiraceae bacterium]
MKTNNPLQKTILITAGSTYLDIDAYACCVAMQELLSLQGKRAIAYSTAPCNYSVCASLTAEGQMTDTLPQDVCPSCCDYIIVDVSDPAFLSDSVPLERVSAVYDHHTGFEDYWHARIGDNAKIEFVGAAATLVYREWQKSKMQDSMSRQTALLLIAAILDNTLNLTSSNTTEEDLDVFRTLCRKENIGEDWCASYFAEVQKSVEADLKTALLKDTKTVQSEILPPRVAQLAVWDAQSLLNRLPDIRKWFGESERYLINIIDIRKHCSYFVCDDVPSQEKIAPIFGIVFENGVAETPVSYLRKEIIKKTQHIPS